MQDYVLLKNLHFKGFVMKVEAKEGKLFCNGQFIGNFNDFSIIEKDDVSAAQKIRLIRSDLSRKDFAEKLKAYSDLFFPDNEKIKISERSIVKYERGERNPSPWQAFIIMIYQASKAGRIHLNELVDLSELLIKL